MDFSLFLIVLQFSPKFLYASSYGSPSCLSSACFATVGAACHLLYKEVFPAICANLLNHTVYIKIYGNWLTRLANLVLIRSSPKALATTTALYVIFLDVVPNILEHYVAIAQPECVKALTLFVSEEVSNQHITNGVHIRVDGVQLTSDGCTEKRVVLLIRTVGQGQILSGIEVFELLNNTKVDRHDGIPHQNLIVELSEVGSRKTHSLIWDNVE